MKEENNSHQARIELAPASQNDAFILRFKALNLVDLVSHRSMCDQDHCILAITLLR